MTRHKRSWKAQAQKLRKKHTIKSLFIKERGLELEFNKFKKEYEIQELLDKMEREGTLK